MPELDTPNTAASEAPSAAPSPAGGRSKDEVALDLMKFIAVQTGYGKSSGTGAGFSGKPAARSSEEYAEALIELFERCRKVVNR